MLTSEFPTIQSYDTGTVHMLILYLQAKQSTLCYVFPHTNLQ